MKRAKKKYTGAPFGGFWYEGDDPKMIRARDTFNALVSPHPHAVRLREMLNAEAQVRATHALKQARPGARAHAAALREQARQLCEQARPAIREALRKFPKLSNTAIAERVKDHTKSSVSVDRLRKIVAEERAAKKRP